MLDTKILIWSLPVAGNAAATANALSPSVIWCVGGTRNVDVELEWKPHRELTSDVRWSVLARYAGALPWRQRWTSAHRRNCICFSTFSQWSLWRSGNMCTKLVSKKSNQAASSRTDSSRCYIIVLSVLTPVCKFATSQQFVESWAECEHSMVDDG